MPVGDPDSSMPRFLLLFDPPYLRVPHLNRHKVLSGIQKIIRNSLI